MKSAVTPSSVVDTWCAQPLRNSLEVGDFKSNTCDKPSFEDVTPVFAYSLKTKGASPDLAPVWAAAPTPRSINREKISMEACSIS